ncbi:MAG TPA: cell division protein ZapA [Gammaproteobacteria bacterium]|nr:cell division protein ZapA [Gammaproteobacteria bacterium]HCY04062.1 cell division protein ZapA [Gammaproteobacteria bacterium]|tara:strand:- start:294 stop:608 length:315 start_codon:yes stop_codon:yes gene_type:complete
MTAENNTLTVSIVGKDYQVACPAGEEESLREAAHYLHKLMESIRASGRVVGLDRVAVMAALNVSNELLQSKNSRADSQAKVTAQVQKLSDRVADAISANKQMQI